MFWRRQKWCSILHRQNSTCNSDRTDSFYRLLFKGLKPTKLATATIKILCHPSSQKDYLPPHFWVVTWPAGSGERAWNAVENDTGNVYINKPLTKPAMHAGLIVRRLHFLTEETGQNSKLILWLVCYKQPSNQSNFTRKLMPFSPSSCYPEAFVSIALVCPYILGGNNKTIISSISIQTWRGIDEGFWDGKSQLLQAQHKNKIKSPNDGKQSNLLPCLFVIIT